MATVALASRRADVEVLRGPLGSPCNALFGKGLRQAVGPAFALPLWSDLVDATLRLQAGLAEQLLALAESLRERAKVAAFGAGSMQSEITALLRDNLARR